MNKLKSRYKRLYLDFVVLEMVCLGKIGFVNICNEDYVNDAAINMAEVAVNALTEKGITVCQIMQPVFNSKAAEKAGKEMLKNEVEGVILFLGTWLECPVVMSVIREIEHLPMCLWGFPMFMEQGKWNSTGSYVSFAMFKGTMERVGYRYKAVLGLPNDETTIKEVTSFSIAASCSERLKRTRIGLVGYASMSMYTGTFDHVFLRVKIGPEIEQIDSYSLINAAEKLKEDECEDVVNYLKSVARIKNDVTREDLARVSKLFIAIRKMTQEKDLKSINIKCQYEFSKEYKMVMCVPLSALAEFGIVSSCEGDILNTVSMVILNYLSGKVVTYGDAINHDGNVVKLSSCGFIPYSFGEENQCEIRKFMPHSGFNGIQNSFVLKPGKVTVMRLVEDRCDYHIIYLTGEGLETELRQGYMPALDVKLDGDINKLIQNYAGQHYAICYGDLSSEIEDYARIIGIKTIRV